MKRVLLTLLGLIVVVGLFAAAGFAGYRFGYAQGAQVTANGDAPQLRPFDEFGPRRMPMHRFDFDRGFSRGFRMGDFPRDGFPMMGFGFFSPWMLLGRIAILALIVWFIYWLFTRSGWRLTRQTTEGVAPKTENE
jgi:uncharacterized membrane protein